MEKKYGGYCKVTVEMEIIASSSWGEDCNLAQVYKQGEQDVNGFLERMQKENKSGGRIRSWEVIKTSAVIAERS